MATVLYGNGVADLRGSINGNVFSRNGNGAYIRNRTTPTNPQTSKQIAVRSKLAYYSTAWRGLTNAQREAWATAAPAFPYTNRLGQPSVYSGQQLFMKFNQQGSQIGITDLYVTPPSPATFPITTLGAVTTTLTNSVLTAFTVAFTQIGSASDFTFEIFVTPGLSAGISNPGTGKFRLLKTLVADDPSPMDLKTAYLALFGSPAAGSKIHIKVLTVSNITGQVQISGITSDVV